MTTQASAFPDVHDPLSHTEACRARLGRFFRGVSHSEIARQTGMAPENVRRYMRRGRIPASFVSAVCRQYGLSADWLLLGREPQSVAAEPAHHVEASCPKECLKVLTRRMKSGGRRSP